MKTFVEAAPEEDIAEERRWLVRWMEDDPFCVELSEQFGFRDRTALAEVLVDVEGFPYEEWDTRLGDTLNQLDDPLGVVIAVLEDKLNAFRVWGQFPDTDLIEKLKDIRTTAREEHRERDPGQRTGRLPPLGKLELRTLVEKLAALWVAATGTRFQQNATWIEGEPKIRSGGGYFVFRVIEHFAADKLPELPGLLREIKVESNPPLAGKRRGRPRRL